MAASGTALTSLVLFMAGFQTTYCADYYIAETNFTSGEHRLFFDLFTTYNKHVRPVDSSHSSTNVFFELSLFNLLRLDTKRQEMVINSEMIMKWKDRFLEWDPDDYNGTTSIRVPYTDIWYPDIILYNTADTNYMGSIINTNAIIVYTGEVELVSHALITSVCNVDVQWYPFDQQLCHLTFASWTYDYEKIRLIMGEPDLSDYEENPEFFLENFWAEPKDYHQPCCPKPFSAIKYHLQLQRRTIFSLFFFIMPGILINICAVMVFSLPAEAGEKVGLGINSMLAMMVFLMAMTENLPPTKKLPLAGVYYGTCISIITFNIIFSVAVMNLNVMGMRGYQVPEPLRDVTLFVARVILVRIPKVVRKSWELDEKVTPVENLNKSGKVRMFNVQPQKQSPNNDMNEDGDVSQIKDPYQRRTVAALESINRILAREEVSTNQNNVKGELVEQWKFVSRVMDRTLFIVFTLICIIFNLSILTSSPFRERFDFCPFSDITVCEDLDMAEIIKLQASSSRGHTTEEEAYASGAHGGGGGGGHLHKGDLAIHSLTGNYEDLPYGDVGVDQNAAAASTDSASDGGQGNQNTANRSNGNSGGGTGDGQEGVDETGESGSAEGSGVGETRTGPSRRYGGRWEEG